MIDIFKKDGGGANKKRSFVKSAFFIIIMTLVMGLCFSLYFEAFDDKSKPQYSNEKLVVNINHISLANIQEDTELNDVVDDPFYCPEPDKTGVTITGRGFIKAAKPNLLEYAEDNKASVKNEVTVLGVDLTYIEGSWD